jgi:diacylglycerol O-acyltransferase / wax synthase
MNAAGFTASMSASDSVMWTIERDPVLRSTVIAISMLDRPPDRMRLLGRVEQAIRDIPRMRQVVEPAGRRSITPRWVDAGNVNIDYHFRTVAAPRHRDRRWLLDFAAALAESGFDKSRPLWEMVVVEGLESGGAALIVKVHHSVTDGVGGVQLLMTLLDSSRRSAHPLSGPAREGRGSQPMSRPFPVRAVAAAGGVVADAVRLPETARNTIRTAMSIGRLVAPAGGRRSSVLVGHSTDWHFDVCERPLDDLKQAGAVAEGSINDVFLAALGGGLYRYHLAHGHRVEELRLTLPVSLRQAGDPLGGNKFVPVRFALPICEPDPIARIQQVGAVSRRWRSEPALPFTEAVAAVLNILPAQLTTAVMGSLLKGVDFVATNIPGVPFRCYIAGAEVTRQFAFGPLSGAAVNAALLSHVGVACIGLNMDRQAVADPDFLMACISEQLDEVITVASPIGSTYGRAP